jgi:hypothetical protein
MSQATVAEPGRTGPEGPLELSRVQMNVVFVTILLGLLLSALDQTIVSTALPTIVGDLGGAGHVSWVVTAYMLAETISAVLAGKFGDLFGRKRVFQLGVAVFIIGSFFCGLANSMVLRPFFREIATAGYLTRDDDGVLVLTERGETEVSKLVAAWKAWLMGELSGWLEAHEVNSEQRAEVEQAIGLITLRLVREADVEARRAGLPGGRPAAAAAAAAAQ